MADTGSKVDSIALDVARVSPQTDRDPDIAKDIHEPSAEAQRGVRDVEAVTLTWTRKSLIAAFLR